MPLGDIQYLELDNPQISISMPALAELAKAGVGTSICDIRHMPVAQLLPAEGHTLQGKHTSAQLENLPSLKSSIWQKIIERKIRNQAQVLGHCSGKADKLVAMAGHVKPKDSTNKEGRAAQYYFPELFGKDFIRDTDGKGTNLWLNYAYTLLRNTTARALVSAGLFCGMGLFHSNRHNAFPLADDLMEPLRPMADAMVWAMAKETDQEEGLSKEVKQRLLPLLNEQVRIGKEQRALYAAIRETAGSLARCFVENEDKYLKLPSLCDLTLTGLCG